MMCKASILIPIIILPLLCTITMLTAQAQDIPAYEGIIKLYSPYNRTYTPTEPLRIDASLDVRYGSSNVYSANYTIDDGPSNKVSGDAIRDEFWSVSYGAIYVTVDLQKLSLGQHKLTLYMSVEYPNASPPYVKSGQATVYFTISSTKMQDTPTTGGKVNIYSPCNKTYNPKSIIPIEASTSTIGQNLTYTATYHIDGKGPYKLHTKTFQTYQYDLFFGSMTATSELYFLPKGQHTITVYMNAYPRDAQTPAISGEATVYFYVGDKEPPSITLEALDGSVFNQTTIPLNFTLNEPTSWIAYSLDNGSKITITANTTLTAKSGPHSLVLYASDIEGNMGQSEMANFTVQVPPSIQKVNLTWLVAVVLAAICIATFLVVYRRKRSL